MSATQHPTHHYLVGLGSNLGDRVSYLHAARDAITASVGPITAVSPLYSTAPIGAADQQFLNGALVCVSALPPEAALAALLAVESQLGRVRRERWGNRVIDLDILLWQAPNGSTSAHDSPTLTIPHPFLLERAFALVPAAAAAPGWLHPTTGLTLAAEVRARGFHLGPDPRETLG